MAHRVHLRLPRKKMRFVMKFLSHVFLSASLFVSAGIAPPLPLETGQADCPLHRHSPPVPGPAHDHSCCQSGHDIAAIPKLARGPRELSTLHLVRTGRNSSQFSWSALAPVGYAGSGIPSPALQLRI
jgi:hypothetical protein